MPKECSAERFERDNSALVGYVFGVDPHLPFGRPSSQPNKATTSQPRRHSLWLGRLFVPEPPSSPRRRKGILPGVHWSCPYLGRQGN